MTVKVLALLTINDDQPQALAQYFATTGPLLESAGARIIQRFNLSDAVIGKHPAETCVVVEYPSIDAVNSVFGSEEYKAIIPIRDLAFSTYTVSLVSGTDDSSHNSGALA